MTATNMRREAYRQIRYRILHNKYQPGQKISEKVICDDLGIGRTPVREAVIRLERDGLIVVVPQSGTYISRIDLSLANHARFVRQTLEVEIMLEAISKLTLADYRRLQRNLLNQRVVAQQNDPDAFFDLDEAFHETFYRVAGRETVWTWLQSLSIQLDRFRWMRLKVKDLDWATILNQHQAILDAMQQRRLDDARFEITAHLRLMLREQKYLLQRFPDDFMNVNPDQLPGEAPVTQPGELTAPQETTKVSVG